MPFCTIDKDVSLHYVTNSPKGDATDLDRKKQAIILLPPIFGAADFSLREQFKDPRLSQNYNLIGLDQRNMGSTKSPLSPQRDAWVDAADIAVFHELLQLPPCHVFTVGKNGSQAAMKFAALFPEKCLSLCLCPTFVQAGEDPDWLQQASLDFIDVCCFPKDLETLEQACMEFLWAAFSGVKVSPELEDEMIAWWQVNMPPTKRGIFLAQSLCTLNRPRMSDEELALIKLPTLFIQGERSIVSPQDKAQELCDKLPNCHIVVIKGGPQFSNFVPEYASLVNRLFCQFLSTVPNFTDRLSSQPTPADPEGVCKAGLARLAKLAGDPSIADRTPSTSLSFSCAPPELVAQTTAQLAAFTKDENEAFHALDEHGRPIRKFSERHLDDWKPALDNLEQSVQEQGLVTAVIERSASREASVHSSTL